MAKVPAYDQRNIRLATVNHYAEPFGYQLFHDVEEDYFYWQPLTDSKPEFKDNVVPVYRLNQMTIAEWIMDLVFKIFNN